MKLKHGLFIGALGLLLIIFSVVFAAPYLVDEDMNLLENDIYNATNVNATYIYQNGTLIQAITNGTGLSLSGGIMSIVLSYWQGLFIELTDSFSGDVSGTYDNTVVADSSHLHDAANITNDNWIEDSQEGNLNVNHSDTSSYITNSTERDLFLNTVNDSYSTTAEIIAFGYYNGSDFVITDYYTSSQVDSGFATIDEPLWSTNYSAFNDTWSSTYNATYDAKVSDNSSWNQSYADTIYADISGDTFTGTMNFNGTGRFRSFVFIDDIEGTTHHINTDLENLDELYSDIFLTPLIINTFNNATGDYINITTDQGEVSISVNIATNVSADNYRLQYDNIILELTNGTNESPILNYVYVYLVDGTPTWAVSASEPTVHHAMAAKVLLGNSGTEPYAASLHEDGQIAHLKNTQETFRKQGLTYLSGLNYVATSTDLEVNNGSYIEGVGSLDVFGPVNVTEGFYLIHTNGTYAWYDNFNDIIKYSDGETIGANKYFNVVFGITPYDGTGNIYAVVQSKPTTEYTSTVLAWADGGHTVSVYPSDSFLKIFFLPVARMIIQEGGNAQLLPQGDYAADYRGGIPGGVSSGGGVTEVDPIWITEKTDYWDTSTDLDTVISDDEISEGKIAFSTACVAGNHYYLNGNDLACEADDDTTYGNSSGIALVGTIFSHSDTSSQANSTNPARTYINDILLDTYGHITSIVTGTETVVDTDTQDLSYDTGTDVISLTDGGSIDITEVDTDTQLTEEQTQDFAWNVLTGTQTLITATYQDLTNDVDLIVENDLYLYLWTNVVDDNIPNNITVASSNNITTTAGININDNVKMRFGTDNDACMYWDGNSLITTTVAANCG